MTAIKVRVQPAKIDPVKASAELRSAIFKEGLKLTPEQLAKWTDTMKFLSWRAPGFRHLFYKLLSDDGLPIPTMYIPTAATDGKRILVNPEVFFKWTLPERVFVTAHEVGHNIFGDVEVLHQCMVAERVPMHDGTFLPFDNDCMQKAADYRLNDMLVQSRIGSMPKQYVEHGKSVDVGCWDREIGHQGESLYEIYRKIYEDKQRNGGGGQPKGFDLILTPGTATNQDPQDAAAQRNPAQWAIEISVAKTLELMARQGTLPGNMSRMFQDVLEPKVPWYDKLRTLFARKVGVGNYNWRRPDRRFIVRDLYMPARAGMSAGWIVVWGDTSGSIGDGEQNKYFAELAQIIEDVNPRRLTVYWCDSEVHQVDELQDANDLINLRYRGIQGGGGGTSVQPVFDAIAKELEVPEMFVGFTDGEVSFPSPPPYSCIWASIKENEYPYGDVVRID